MALVPKVSINSDVQKPITIQKIAFTLTKHKHTPRDDTDSEDHFYELSEEDKELKTQPVPEVNVDAVNQEAGAGNQEAGTGNQEADSDILKKKTRGLNKK